MFSRGYSKQSGLTYLYVWNGSGTIESLAGLDYLGTPNKELTGLDRLEHSAGLDYFETQIKTQQGWTVFRPESIV